LVPAHAQVLIREEAFRAGDALGHDFLLILRIVHGCGRCPLS
jgi:hypothetical protein